MRKKKETIKGIKFCPSCGSSNIKWELPQTWSVWKCWDCGYVGAFVIEDSSISVEIRKDYLKRTGQKVPDIDENVPKSRKKKLKKK